MDDFTRRMIRDRQKFNIWRKGVDAYKKIPDNLYPRYTNKQDINHDFFETQDLENARFTGRELVPDVHVMIDNKGKQSEREYARTKLNEVARRLFPVGLRFRQVLACGGNALAALFEAQNKTTKLFNKVVVKMALSDDYVEGLQREKAFLRLLKGDPHTVQIMTVDELRSLPGGYPTHPSGDRWPDDPSQLGEPTREQIDAIDNDDSLIMLEYMPYGSLDHYIAMAKELGHHFSTEGLWRMLLCLAKACVAMEARSNIVHFDLNATNVFVDAAPMLHLGSDAAHAHADACDHSRSLYLKVADFGMSRSVDAAVLADKEAMLAMRKLGKDHFYVPEQYTAEWDYVRVNPTNEDVDIAGKYSSKINIHQIGQTMLMAMMRASTEDWPRNAAVEMSDFRAAGHTYGTQTKEEVAKLPKNKKTKVHTIAWPLTQKASTLRYEPSLRELVMRLATYRPADRPTPAELLAIVEARLALGFPAGGPHETDWITQFIRPEEPQPVFGYSQVAGAVHPEDAGYAAPKRKDRQGHVMQDMHPGTPPSSPQPPPASLRPTNH